MKNKLLTKEYVKICTDRLTRFKPVSEKYSRVIDDILTKHLILSSKEDIEPLSIEQKAQIAARIFNQSLPYSYDPFISDILYKEENETYNLNEFQKELLETEFNLTGAIKYIDDRENLPLNLKRLKILVKNRDNYIKSTGEENELLFPVKKVILTEGATEETLLPVFATNLGYDFNKNGIFVLGAGGKNQVARKYYSMREELKIPVFILLDSDANETMELILPKLKDKDKIHIIKHGEFEDILPIELIVGAVNSNFPNDLHFSKDDFVSCEKMTRNLHDLYKNKGFGEYKKAEFAKIVKNFLLNNNKPVVSQEIEEIIEEIKNL